jgi:hypothetical protein
MQFHRAPLAGGIFLPASEDSIDQYLELSAEHKVFDSVKSPYARGVNLVQHGFFAARLSGDSMKDWDIFDRDVIISQRSEFEYVESGRIVVIQKLGDKEATGAWSLKRLIIEKPRWSSRNILGDEIDSANPTIILRSHNQKISPWELDGSERYRVRGFFRHALRPKEVRLVDTDALASRSDDDR